ncbi:MAG: histidine kinase [Lachnospiraceae bacterium]|nr:histidine kinase [Lachnospiraceae bacterium]
MEKRQKRLYTKLLLIYTGVTLGVISVLAAVFLSNFRMRTLESNQNYIDMLGKDVSDYVQDAKSEVDYIVRDLYKSTTELDDLLYYLTEDTQTYLKHALDEYYRQEVSVYKGIDDFIAETFSGNSHIIRITLVSHFNKDITTHYPDKRIWHSADYNMVVNRLENNDLARKGEFSFVREIRDPVTWETSGYMIVTFSSDALENYYNFYSRADLLVFNSEGTVVYNSQGDDEAAKIVIPEHESEEVWEKNLNAYVNTSGVNDYRVVSYMPKKQAEKMSETVWLPVLLFSFAALVISQMLIRYYLGRMERRLNAIIEGMEQVTRGNLDIILKTNQKGDELDIISEHFNSMCRRLDRYIQKSYLAEIEQTNAEMEALQTQINPHFLYNTLEAIRMKAICSGDRDVAKMIYSMTVMFRSQVKESSVITLVQELHYCKKYLDLF